MFLLFFFVHFPLRRFRSVWCGIVALIGVVVFSDDVIARSMIKWWSVVIVFYHVSICVCLSVLFSLKKKNKK